MNYVYILKCSDNTLYTGWTNDIVKRLDAHNRGKGAKYTRARLPVSLEYIEMYENSVDAQKREYYIKKRLTRKAKQELIAEATKGYQCVKADEITCAKINGELVEITSL